MKDKKRLNDKLHEKIQKGTIDDVRKLIKKGADVNENGFNIYRRPIFTALRYKKSIDIIRILIDAGTSANTLNENQAIAEAIIYDVDFDVVQVLIDAGADVNCPGSGTTPLFYALRIEDSHSKSKLEWIQFLINSGADVNKGISYDRFILHHALFYDSNIDVIRKLLDAGADVDTRDENGTTPLSYAIYKNDEIEIIRALIDAGSDVNARDNRNETPLYNAVIDCKKFHLISILIDAGANPNIRANSGETAFDVVKKQKNTDIGSVLYMKLMFAAEQKDKNDTLQN